MSKIKVGDFVMWRGAWGSEPPAKAKVIGLEITETRRDKEGTPATEVSPRHDHFIVDLDNGKWAYGWQVEQLQ